MTVNAGALGYMYPRMSTSEQKYMLEDTENKCLVHVAFLQGNYYRKSISTFVTFFRSAVKVISSFFIDRQRSGKNHHKNAF